MLRHNAENFPDKPFLGTRSFTKDTNGQRTYGKYDWVTCLEADQMAKKILAYLSAKDLCPRNVDAQCKQSKNLLKVIGLYSKNRQEWALMDAAAAYGNITSVPLYETLGKEYLSCIIEETQLKTIACSKETLKHLLTLKQQGKIQVVKTLICFDSDVTAPVVNQLKEAGFQVILFKDMIEKDSDELLTSYVENEECASPSTFLMDDIDIELNGDSIYTICYTSSSTGKPKGALLSNGNVLANARCLHLFDAHFEA